MFIESVAHNLQAKRVARFTFASHIPRCQVAFSDIDHMTDHVAHFPLTTARLDVPVVWIVNDVVEFSAFGARDIEYGISTAAIIHRVGWHRSLLLIVDVSLFQR